MPLPPWTLFVIAGWLLLFGSFRIAVAVRGRRRSEEEGGGGRGSLAMSWRRHLIFGIFYLVVGAYLVALGFGIGGPAAAEEHVPLPAERSEHLQIDRGT